MKEAIVFGAGNIGRGFLGQLLCEGGYLVTFVDLDVPLLEALSARGAYTVRLVTNEAVDEVVVGPVRALHAADVERVADAVAHAEIGVTAVGAAALKPVARTFAAGVARRKAAGNAAPLNLILCENLKGAAGIFRGLVREALPPDCQGFLAEHVGFVDTVIGRMVPAPTPEMRTADPSLIAVEPYRELPVDRAGFLGEPPEIPGMLPFTPFTFYTERKLYIHNAGHSVLAYLGYLAGYEYGYQALADDEIYFQARGAMDESARALTRKYTPEPGALRANIDDLLHRFGNRALGDTVLRLGRDPVRKLARSDRLVGAALNCLDHGVYPANLLSGIAAALRFDHPDDPVASDLQARLQRDGLSRTLSDVSSLRADEALHRLVLERQAAVSGSLPIAV